jgi:hypothetical protein
VRRHPKGIIIGRFDVRRHPNGIIIGRFDVRKHPNGTNWKFPRCYHWYVKFVRGFALRRFKPSHVRKTWFKTGSKLLVVRRFEPRCRLRAFLLTPPLFSKRASARELR